VWWTVKAPAAQHYATTEGGYGRIALNDGSVLELNSNTELSVRYTAAERRVHLLRGEAHFTVAKNPHRPFLVEAESIAVRAVGTAFNVRIGISDVEVLVTEGRVQLGDDRSVWSPAAERPVLTLNERALIPTSPPAPGVPAVFTAPLIEKIAPDAVREALAWQGARLVFVNEPLASVVAQFNRRNLVQLVIADEELNAVPVGGSFRAENLDAFVRLLGSGNEIVAERPDPRHIVLHKAK
jgi:transmembrane sensor